MCRVPVFHGPLHLAVHGTLAMHRRIVDQAPRQRGPRAPYLVERLLALAGAALTLAAPSPVRVGDGPSIPPAKRECAFDRFQRGEVHEVEGSGLELAIARAVAKRRRGGGQA